MSVTRSAAAALAIAAFATLPAAAAPSISAVRVAAGLARPVFVTHAPGDTSRLFIGEQHTGQIKILNLTGPNAGTINATPFVTVPAHTSGNEQGLLGMAFHPNYANNGQFYVNYTAPGGSQAGFVGGQTNVRRYTRSAGDANLANAASAQTVMIIDQPQTNHNGGWLGFGPKDGYLYIATGDGGGSNDNNSVGHAANGNAQTITNNLLGKMLRIDVNADEFAADANRNYAIPRGGAGNPVANPFASTTGDDEIWAYGLRNPFRAGFDKTTGAMFIGDVGQDNREEIDFIPGGSAGGQNFGWRVREGTIATPTGGVGGALQPGMIDPIHDYIRSVGTTITGGHVVRNGDPGLDGRYFFADIGTSRLWSFIYDGATITDFVEHTSIPTGGNGTVGGIASFGEDALGNLYVVDMFTGGEVFRIVPEPGSMLLLAGLGLPLLRRRPRGR
ncbi:MAG TPA: PQQ-dependent sugar dehydrogenase [Tepidisphaeraceae bacterium]|nr:PQQ-dependent sugar dehydrogenase [Tepidisphaeraceae bacterium]